MFCSVKAKYRVIFLARARILQVSRFTMFFLLGSGEWRGEWSSSSWRKSTASSSIWATTQKLATIDWGVGTPSGSKAWEEYFSGVPQDYADGLRHRLARLRQRDETREIATWRTHQSKRLKSAFRRCITRTSEIGGGYRNNFRIALGNLSNLQHNGKLRYKLCATLRQNMRQRVTLAALFCRE